MRRSITVRLLILLLLASLLSSCGPKPSAGRQDLTWDGRALTGLPFYERQFPQVSIYYTEPTMPDAAENLGEAAQSVLAANKAWGRLSPDERLELWLVPLGQDWPKGTPFPDTGMAQMRAVKPRTVIIHELFLWGEDWKRRLTYSGFADVLAAAVTQESDSPAFAAAWLQDGIGRVMSSKQQFFPGGHFVLHFPGRFEGRSVPWRVDDILKMADPDADWTRSGPISMMPNEAAAAVIALVMDRWGMTWWERYAGKVDELTPMEAIRWATGASDDAEAKRLFLDRMKKAIDEHIGWREEANVTYPIPLVDHGADRVAPELPQLPVSGDNRSALAYRFDVQYDPATRTVAGDETLTWTNGEGIVVDRLYFTLWGNSTAAHWYGGYTVVDSVTVNGQAVPFAARGMDLDVPLVHGVQPGERIEVRIAFRTRLPILRPELPPGRGNGQDSPKPKPKPAPGEELSLSLWYPALAVLDEKGWHPDSFPMPRQVVAERADYEVRITVPQDTRVTRLGQQPKVTEDGAQLTYEFSDKDELWSATLITQP